MFKIITIPFDRGAEGFDDEILNRFAMNKRVKSYRAEFFPNGETVYWTVFIEYDPVVEKPPAKEIEGLDDSQKLFLERLKAWRRERAEKDGVPVFIIATNKELVEIVRSSPSTLEALKDIRGFGRGKVSKYGKDIIDLVQAFHEKT